MPAQGFSNAPGKWVPTRMIRLLHNIAEPGQTTPQAGKPRPSFALFNYGFRPFFLLAGVYAALVMPLWAALLFGADLPRGPLPPSLWHAHEMLFGFVAAAIAGFMLTAVPSWTGQRGYAGAPLLLLVGLWLAGRLVVSLPLGLPLVAVAIIDLAFIPALALTILPALLRAGKNKNLAFIGLLALLFASNAMFHAAGAGSSEPLRLGLNVVLFMLTMIGGRIIPAFTSAALKQRGMEISIPRHRLLDRAVPVLVASIIVVDLVAPGGRLAGLLAGLAAMLLLLQLARWQGRHTLPDALLWVLHVAYLWIPVALLLKTAWLFGVQLPPTSWLHALGSGAMATMILGVMSRASLGHTGRPLEASRATTLAYLLLTLAAASRVFGPVVAPQLWSLWINLATILWSLAFTLFVVLYAPILCRPRADGRAG